jgi:sugar phosphate isomerase/epimerase
MYTEQALLTVARLGVKYSEIFLNSTRELDGEIFSDMKNIIGEYGMEILALHPFSTPMETLFLFSSYDRRVTELLDLYKRYFEKMSELNARVFVVHGALATSKCSDARYCERFYKLIETGREFGVTVAQENVCYCKSAETEFLKYLNRELGRDAAFVLDLKQARRSGVCPFEIVDALRDKIVHLHLSDFCADADCLPIGDGGFDFARLFDKLREVGYKGGAVVELYRENYNDYSQLEQSVRRLERIIKNKE